VDGSNEFIKQKTSKLNNFVYSCNNNPIHVALEPLGISGDLGDKNELLQKLETLDELRRQVSDRRHGSSLDRDMYMIDIKNTAEKYFI
jgi:hypothetical protein